MTSGRGKGPCWHLYILAIYPGSLLLAWHVHDFHVPLLCPLFIDCKPFFNHQHITSQELRDHIVCVTTITPYGIMYTHSYRKHFPHLARPSFTLDRTIATPASHLTCPHMNASRHAKTFVVSHLHLSIQNIGHGRDL